ncbi:radical SAM protein [Pseudenhygromyxa sp. WMMC2535]|uniref:radical SAM/SPASM domain-containing protein n=1 Tax=Pseudenhygromyxa sp. WMMC2535 TaxID=2712867 RepID=UPI001556AA5C|nr:radical SAM protein [Pseudenhygromyxa sp. WMMC2535]NVB39075.1 radical SAM protein [Pseudenhygromyxa sp. WMMC2535]
MKRLLRALEGLGRRAPKLELEAQNLALNLPTPRPDGPILVELGPEQPHPIDLRWVDELVTNLRPHVMLRPEDELLIVVPNSPHKMNATALRVLAAMIEGGATIADVLAREGDSAQRRRELHWFFSDLHALLEGRLGEGHGRRAVQTEAFSADFCRYPVISEIALTYRCNLSCEFCYAGCEATGLPAGWSEDATMSDDEVCRALDIIRRDGRCPSVSFTGGEPTTRPALPRFVAHAKGLGMKVNIISNGQRLGPKLVAALAAAGLDSAQLSLEGPSPEIHDTIVRRPGAFDRLFGAVERLRAAGIRVHTNTTISRSNVEHLEAIVDRIADAGLARLTMNLILPCGTAKDGQDGLQLRYSDMGPILLRVRERAAARGVEFIWYSPIPACVFNTVAHGLGNQGCAAADGLIHVNPAGDVLPCSSFDHHESLGNLLRDGFDAVWQSKTARFFRDKQMSPASCEGCPNAAFCQGACTLYWREVGLEELGGQAADRPPKPPGWAAATRTPEGRVHLPILAG